MLMDVVEEDFKIDGVVIMKLNHSRTRFLLKAISVNGYLSV
jgi:hypothetical protein